MKRKNLFLIPLLIFVACAKKNEPVPSDDSNVLYENKYYPTAIGNYWIYDTYMVYDTGGEINLLRRDSLVITKDTVINGKKYAVLEGSFKPFESLVNFIRDSSGYVVDNQHRIILSSTNAIDTLGRFFTQDTSIKLIHSLKWWMETNIQTIDLPTGGTFDVKIKDTEEIIDFYEASDRRKRILKSFYSKGIGLVLDQYNYQYFMNIGVFEKRLIRYRVKGSDN